MNDGFYGNWCFVEGARVEIVHLPEAMDLLVDYYRPVAGEHPDWDDYRAAMERGAAGRCASVRADSPSTASARRPTSAGARRQAASAAEP